MYYSYFIFCKFYNINLFSFKLFKAILRLYIYINTNNFKPFFQRDLSKLYMIQYKTLQYKLYNYSYMIILWKNYCRLLGNDQLYKYN